MKQIIKYVAIVSTAVLLPLSGQGQVNRNHALVLDGVNDYVVVPDTVSLRLSSNNFTFCAWVYLESYDQYNSAIVIKRTGTPGDVEGYVLCIGGTEWPSLAKKFYYKVKGGANPAVISASEIPLHQWTHIAMVHDVETRVATIYINGEYDTEVSNILTPDIANTTDLRIGMDSMTDLVSGHEFYFHGMLDEIQFWSRKLTPDEITSFKRRPLSGKEKGLIGYWRFKHGTTEDISGNELHGTLGPDTETALEPILNTRISPAVSIIVESCMPTTILELQYTRDLVEGSWTTVTREYQELTSGGRVYSDPVIDNSRMYRLVVINEQ